MSTSVEQIDRELPSCINGISKTMLTWCSNNAQKQRQISNAHDEFVQYQRSQKNRIYTARISIWKIGESSYSILPNDKGNESYLYHVVQTNI